MPAVLLEYGFLTNDAERAKVQNVEHMRDLVAKTARGIAAWLK
jgi:N-acetylmuramoyl-L-alanine amidase